MAYTRQAGLHTFFRNVIPSVTRILNNTDPGKNDFIKPQIDQEKSQQRLDELSKKFITSVKEERELELLSNPNTFLYAAEILRLESKENKSDVDHLEYLLLTEPTTCHVAYRLIELLVKKDKTSLENQELQTLTNPYALENADKIMYFLTKKANKGFFTENDKRESFLYLNAYSSRYAAEIFALEKKPELSTEELNKLEKFYLIKLANIPIHYEFDLNADLDTIDTLEVTRLKLTKELIDDAARQLCSHYENHIIKNSEKTRQDFSPPDALKKRLESLVEASLGDKNATFSQLKEKLQADEENRNVLEQATALAITRVLFDSNQKVDEEIVSSLKNFLMLQIDNDKFALAYPDHKDLAKAIKYSIDAFEKESLLNNIEIELPRLSRS